MGQASLDKRFVVVAGKGGVGKSTVACALGLRAARMGRRTVIAELGARSAVPGFFGVERSGYEPVALAENLYTIHIERTPALHEYALRKLKFESLYRMVFENGPVRRFLDVIPGMHELLILGKAFDLEREQEDGRPAWDQVIVEAPATGHGVSLLRLPQVILSVLSQGPMAEEAQRMRTLLEDEERTAMVIVTLLEEMPVRETLELYEAATTILHMPVGPLVVNRVWPRDLSGELEAAWDPEEARFTDEWGVCQGLEPVQREALALLRTSRRRRRWQEEHLATLQATFPSPILSLPDLPRGPFDRDAIARLADAMG